MDNARIDHVFLALPSFSVDLKDYTMYTEKSHRPGWYDSSQYPVVYNQYYGDKLTKDLASICDQQFKPNPGDEVYVVPVCFLPIQDIRNNYKVKRELDSGVCNVFSPAEQVRERTRIYNCIGYNVEHRVVVAIYVGGSVSWADAKETMRGILPDSLKDIELQFVLSYKFSLFFRKMNEAYRYLLNGELKKPCIHYANLPMKRNELTADLLYMVYKSGFDWQSNSVVMEKLVIQLSALAQTNWRDYPGTMRILFDDLLRYRGAWTALHNNPNNYPKAVRELATFDFGRLQAKFKDEKDFQLSKQLLDTILNVGEKGVFVTLSQLLNKITNNGISTVTFNKVYNTMVKINLKERCEE